jgi:hypothetical protein
VRRWQGLILGSLALLGVLLLIVQLIVGFKISNQAVNKIDELTGKFENPTDEQQKEQNAKRGAFIGALSIHTTLWFRLAFVLLVLAALGGFFEFWGRRRGNRPPPKIELAW